MTTERKIVQTITQCSRLEPYKITHLVDTKSCKWTQSEWKGQGNQGTVYMACCNEDCKFVVKSVNHSPSTTFDSVQKEVAMQQEFAAQGLAPRILEAFMCDDKSYIISEAKSRTLDSTCDRLAGDWTNDGWDFERDPNKKRWLVGLLQQAIFLLERAHDAGLMHDDAHLQNFMTDAKDVTDEKSYQQAISTLQFIDFGYSKRLSEDPEIREQEKYDDTDRFYGAISDMPWGGKIQPLLKFKDYVPPY